jgi:hypothetical protein
MSPHLPSLDDHVPVTDGPGSTQTRRGPVGVLARREAPASGLRPTVRFTIALALTLAWVAFSVWVSEPWRGELEAAIGPVMGWVTPLFLAYIPALVIGFMIFTLLITRYEELPLDPPRGDWPEGEWPAVTIAVAAWNEATRSSAPWNGSRNSRTKVASRSSSRTTTRPTTRRCSQTRRVRASGSATGVSSRRSRASTMR